MVDELTTGIDGTEAKAGIIGELATQRDFITPPEERVFRAAARAHKKTWCAAEYAYLARDSGTRSARPVRGRRRRPEPRHHWPHGRPAHLDNVHAVLARGAECAIRPCGHGALSARQTAREERLPTGAGRVRGPARCHTTCATSTCCTGTTGLEYDHMLTSFVPALRAAGVSEADITDHR